MGPKYIRECEICKKVPEKTMSHFGEIYFRCHCVIPAFFYGVKSFEGWHVSSSYKKYHIERIVSYNNHEN